MPDKQQNTTPTTHNISVRIEFWGEYNEPLTTLGALRAHTSSLSDNTPIYATKCERMGEFDGLQIGGTV